jgi:transposase
VAAFQEELKDVSPEQRVYVDETGIDKHLHREYGWSERGKPVQGCISGKKFKRTSIVAAMLGKKVLAPIQYSGTMDGSFFEGWFCEYLLPALPPQSVIIMDNASFHGKKRLLKAIADTDHRLLFLPPYSPELNPIEHYWSMLKRELRKTLPFHPNLDSAISSAFQVG